MKNINLLEAIVSTMDSISVVGIDNQDKFVGCANAIRSVIRSLKQEQAQKEAVAEPVGNTDNSGINENSERS